MLVRKLRLQRGWTQDQLAEIADLSVRTIQRIERGGPASLETARSLAVAFDVDASLFTLEGSTDMTQTQTEAVKADEAAALAYAKTLKDYWTGVAVFAVIVAAFVIFRGFTEPTAYLVFGAMGVGFTIQGLFVHEILRWPGAEFERNLVERRLGRKL